MAEAAKVVAKTTFFTTVGNVDKCVREGEEYAATDPVVKTNKQFFESKPTPATRRKRGE